MISTKLKRMLRAGLLAVCTAAIGCTGTLVYAEPSTKDLEGAASGLRGELNNLNGELGNLTSEVDSISSQIGALKGEMSSTQARMDEAQKKGQEQYDAMKLRIKYMYESGDISFLELLCSAESMTDFLNKSDFIKTVSDYDRNMLQELLDTQEEIRKDGEKLEKQQAELAEKQKNLDSKKTALEGQISSASSQLDQYNDQIARAKAEEALVKARQAEAAKAAQEQQNALIFGSGTATEPFTPGPTVSTDGKRSLGTFKVTHYCPCYYCSEGWGASTSSGAIPQQGRTIAVDPSVIPMGSRVIINGNVYVAEDVGGAIKGNRIDVYVTNHAVATQLGVYYAEVYMAD